MASQTGSTACGQHTISGTARFEQSHQAAAQALDSAIRVGTSENAKHVLAPARNRPYYRQFSGARF